MSGTALAQEFRTAAVFGPVPFSCPDGETNASVPKGTSIDELTPELVLRLLADRAAMGPSKKASRKKAAPKKAAAPKRAAKKAVKRAPVKKKAAKKKG